MVIYKVGIVICSLWDSHNTEMMHLKAFDRVIGVKELLDAYVLESLKKLLCMWW